MSLLNKLPIELAESIQSMVWSAAWHTANTRAGYSGDAQGDLIHFNNNVDNVLEKGKELDLTDTILEDIKWMAWNAAWHTANTRAGYSEDAKKDREKFERHSQNIKNANQITTELADDIKGMAWNAAWHTANTRNDHKEDAKADLHRSEAHFNKIVGEITVKEITFLEDEAKILSSQPKVITKQEMINNSGSEQQQKFSVSYSKGKTNSWSHTMGFKAGVTTSATAGFKLVAEATVEVSFETSYEYSWGGSTSESETFSYEFPVKVAPGETVTAQAIVHEATMDVPYIIKYEIGDVTRTINGIWNGVAYSKVTSEFSK